MLKLHSKPSLKYKLYKPLQHKPTTQSKKKSKLTPFHHPPISRFSTQSTTSSPILLQTSQQLSKFSTTVLPIKVTNSLTGQLEPLTIRHAISTLPSSFTSKFLHSGYNNALTWYVCGPTVYDASHIGHARTYTNFDMMRRIITNYFNIPLVFAMGVTDIDDKIITRAKERDVHWLTLARHFEHEFNMDLQQLNVLPPDCSLRVSEFIPDIIDYISQLHSRGLTYSTADGVYFDVLQFTQNKHLYAKLRYSNLFDAAAQVQKALLSNDVSLFDEDGSQPPSTVTTASTSSTYSPSAFGHNAKKHSADFCLWKYQKHDFEPAFQSPFGTGRPGWHIECSAMTASALGVGIDIHSGGVDLRFPHHCNEIAQAEGCLGWGENHFDLFSTTPTAASPPVFPTTNSTDTDTNTNTSHMNTSQHWTSIWIHTGHLNIAGLKMSKSLKNFITIQQLFHDGYDADEFRMLCATSPYSSTLDFTPIRLQQCRLELKNVFNFSELIQRTLKQTKLQQIQEYNVLSALSISSTNQQTQSVEIDFNGKIVIKGDANAIVYDTLSQLDFLKATSHAIPESASTTINTSSTTTTTTTTTTTATATSTKQTTSKNHSPPSSETSILPTSHQTYTDLLYAHPSLQVRPQQAEYDLEQFLLTTQSTIQQHFSHDFNTQAAISSLSTLISSTTRYISDKQQRNEPPSQYLLTQVSTYVYKIYNILGFQFAGAVGGNWNTLATGINANTMKNHGNSINLKNNSSTSTTSTILYAEDGVPIYLHQLANQRYQMKQAAIEGSKLLKQINKLNLHTLVSTPPHTLVELNSIFKSDTEQVVLDKTVYEKLISAVQNQTQVMISTCDTIRDQVFIEAGHTLKDTASVSNNQSAAVTPYFIRPVDKFD